jgi:hypothetical protein
MAYSSEDLKRRLQLSRELLSTHERPVLTKDLVDERLSGPGRHLEIDFPAKLGPKPDMAASGNPDAALPKADVVVLTYTSDEGKALADVMSPGRFSSDWTHYTRNFDEFLPKIRNGAPARKAGRLASHQVTEVDGKRVLLMKSELHMHQDFHTVNGHPTLPILDLFKQIIAEAKPSHFFCIGTAGGVYTKVPLGAVAASRSTKFMCEKDFKEEPYANKQFQSDWQIPVKHSESALELMAPFATHLTIASGDRLTDCPCRELQGHDAPKPTFLIDGHGGIPAFHPVLSTDFFEFGTDKNHLSDKGMAVEMDDAVLGLACSEVAAAPKWASIRNYSDPTINGTLDMRAQETCASRIYLRYGYWTSVAGALATWSVIAGL